MALVYNAIGSPLMLMGCLAQGSFPESALGPQLGRFPNIYPEMLPEGARREEVIEGKQTDCPQHP